MKKVILIAIVILPTMTSLFAKDDPFATKRFVNKDTEISFRYQDDNGIPLVQMKDNDEVYHYYYDFDSDNLVFYYSDGTCAEFYQYSFIKDGSAIRLFDENGRFLDLDSDNGKSTVDVVMEQVNIVMSNAVLYAAGGAGFGVFLGNPMLGGAVGALVGIGKGVLVDVLHVF